MSLFIISAANGPYRPNTWFECHDDGCQEVEMRQVGNRAEYVRTTGLIIPHKDVVPYATAVGKRGIVRHGY